MTGLPIHLFLHQHPSLPPSLRLSRLPPKARHLRVYHVYTPPDNPPSFLLEKSYRPGASPIHPLAFSKERERERESSISRSFLRTNSNTSLSLPKFFNAYAVRYVEEKSVQGGGARPGGRKEKEEDSSDDDDRLGFHER